MSQSNDATHPRRDPHAQRHAHGDDDEGGRLLGELLRAAGFAVVSHAIVREEPDVAPRRRSRASATAASRTRSCSRAARASRRATARSRRSRRCSTRRSTASARRSAGCRGTQIGPRAILSRAVAGVVRGRVVAALPGSPKAVRLAVDALLAPTLAHAVELASGRGGHHAKHDNDEPGTGGGTG